MEEEKLEYRMYCLVLRQLNSINKGVQAIHSCLEYANKFNNNPDYQQYINVDKTLIILDGGTYPDLCKIVGILTENNINFSYFNEPDLGNIYTSISFLADNRIWDDKHIKNYEDYCYELGNELHGMSYDIWLDSIGGSKNLVLLDIIKNKRLSL